MANDDKRIANICKVLKKNNWTLHCKDTGRSVKRRAYLILKVKGTGTIVAEGRA